MQHGKGVKNWIQEVNSCGQWRWVENGLNLKLQSCSRRDDHQPHFPPTNPLCRRRVWMIWKVHISKLDAVLVLFSQLLIPPIPHIFYWSDLPFCDDFLSFLFLFFCFNFKSPTVFVYTHLLANLAWLPNFLVCILHIYCGLIVRVRRCWVAFAFAVVEEKQWPSTAHIN